MSEAMVGIIGGSGLYEMDGVEVIGETRVNTPFGETSDVFVLCKIEGVPVAFMPRHGRGHRIPPHKINYRANIWALKKIGATHLISVSAVGSMKENIHPGDLVIVDQFIDRTKGRPETFFDDGIVGHVPFAYPVCEDLATAAYNAAVSKGVTVHKGGTYVCIEGPAFSTRAESLLYRSWGVDVIGMTNYQEAKLAREAELCFATIALSTDYDCWHVEEGPVDVAMIIKTLQENVKKAKSTIKELFTKYDFNRSCACHDMLSSAIMTDHKLILPATRDRLDPIIKKYVK